MADEKWQKVREIFNSAVRRQPAERRRFVRQACGDDKTLLAEVESLLMSLESAGSFMETPAVAKVADAIEAETKKLEAGKCFGHYEIVEQIGAGGMGEIYLAEDKKLDRKVAVKILNEKFSSDESNLNRFVREAKAASALNHPNILVIHEIGETDDAHFIVSEFIKGKTLREILREKSLSLSEVLDVSIQIAGALVAAHEAGLIHRDIKPENVMIRPDGFVKVLDFGLAKLVEQKNKSFLGLDETTARQSQTGKGVILGTVNYMSPEQAKAESVDERTDVFSFGALVYEMLSGRTPFAGDSVSETFANLINGEPSPLARFSEGVPDELQHIVSKTLRKKKDERYQTMKDVLGDLKDLRENLKPDGKLTRAGNTTETLHATTARTQHSFSQQIKRHKPLAALALIALLVGAAALGYYFYPNKNAAGDGKKSIAVLPLKPIGAANRDEIYEVGIADSLVIRLGAMKGFIVRPLSATRKYADVKQDPLAAGREQQVDYVLASNYQLAGGRIRITSQLFNVASGEILETYKSEKDAGDIFAMQDQVAGEVGNVLLARFAAASSSPTGKRGTSNEEAYRLYLQGKNLTERRTAADVKKGIEYFEQAIKLDPNYALAYAGMGIAFVYSGHLSGLPREQYEKAREAVGRALELEPNLAEAYSVRAALKFRYEWDFAGAEQDYRRANELDPNRLQGFSIRATDLTYLGRFDEALAQVEAALEIDPTSLDLQILRGRILYFARRYDEAIVQLKRVVEVDVNAQAYAFVMLAYEMKGDYGQAFEWFMRWQKRSHPERLEVYQKAYETGGWKEVRQKGVEFEKAEEQTLAGNAFRVARQAALIGEKETAFEYLNKAIEKRHGQMVMLKVEPAFDSIRDDPRFDELLRRVGLN